MPVTPHKRRAGFEPAWALARRQFCKLPPSSTRPPPHIAHTESRTRIRTRNLLVQSEACCQLHHPRTLSRHTDSRGGARTRNPPVNSRMLCQLSHPRIKQGRHGIRTRPQRWGALLSRQPAGPAGAYLPRRPPSRGGLSCDHPSSPRGAEEPLSFPRSRRSLAQRRSGRRRSRTPDGAAVRPVFEAGSAPRRIRLPDQCFVTDTPGRTRTCDLRARNPPLYPLSHRGTHPLLPVSSVPGGVAGFEPATFSL